MHPSGAAPVPQRLKNKAQWGLGSEHLACGRTNALVVRQLLESYHHGLPAVKAGLVVSEQEENQLRKGFNSKEAIKACKPVEESPRKRTAC